MWSAGILSSVWKEFLDESVSLGNRGFDKDSDRKARISGISDRAG
jgi:hypothetical protein